MMPSVHEIGSPEFFWFPMVPPEGEPIGPIVTDRNGDAFMLNRDGVIKGRRLK